MLTTNSFLPLYNALCSYDYAKVGRDSYVTPWEAVWKLLLEIEVQNLFAVDKFEGTQGERRLDIRT
jgi:hypothetical protein